MRLHRLQIKAFGPFAGTEEVDFDRLSDAGLFLLHGQTGAGKSSVLDAVCYALYGRVPGARGAVRPHLRSDHAAVSERAEVRLELTVQGRRLEVTRSPEWERPKKRGEGTTSEKGAVALRERIGGRWETVTTRADELGHLLQDLLGMRLDQFTKVVLLPQGEFAAFLRSDAEARRGLLEQLFSTGRFSDVETWLAERRRELGRDVARVRARSNELLARADEHVAHLTTAPPRTADPAAPTPTSDAGRRGHARTRLPRRPRAVRAAAPPAPSARAVRAGSASSRTTRPDRRSLRRRRPRRRPLGPRPLEPRSPPAATWPRGSSRSPCSRLGPRPCWRPNRPRPSAAPGWPPPAAPPRCSLTWSRRRACRASWSRPARRWEAARLAVPAELATAGRLAIETARVDLGKELGRLSEAREVRDALAEQEALQAEASDLAGGAALAAAAAQTEHAAVTQRRTAALARLDQLDGRGRRPGGRRGCARRRGAAPARRDGPEQAGDRGRGGAAHGSPGSRPSRWTSRSGGWPCASSGWPASRASWRPGWSTAPPARSAAPTSTRRRRPPTTTRSPRRPSRPRSSASFDAEQAAGRCPGEPRRPGHRPGRRDRASRRPDDA